MMQAEHFQRIIAVHKFPACKKKRCRRPTVGCCEVYRHGEIELRPGGRLSTSAWLETEM